MLRNLLRNFFITAYTMSITVKAMRKCCGKILDAIRIFIRDTVLVL